jgi:shikimate dehydrogenase
LTPVGRTPTGATAVAGVIGDPVAHSLSPVLHNAAFAECGLDWVYVAFPVRAGRLDEALRGAEALSVRGLSVTMPHKQAVAEACRRASETVRLLGAASTVRFDAEGPVAESNDGEGLLEDLAHGLGFDPDGRRCLVIGAGGAARAAILALARAGAREVAVVNRSADRAERAAALAGPAGRVVTPEAARGADLVVNATPLGMVGHRPDPPGAPAAGGGPAAIDGIGAALAAGQIAYDMVYAPVTTPFLETARAGGAVVRNGLGMLVHQAGRQFQQWTGATAPLEAMWAAARQALGDRPPVA